MMRNFSHRTPLRLPDRLKERDPLFQGLLNFSLLYLLREQVPLPNVEKDYLGGLFDVRARSLVSADKILGLSRKDLYSDARLRLPFWKVIPVLSSIIGLLKKMFQTSPKKKPSSSSSAAVKTLGPATANETPSTDATHKARKAKFKEDIQALRERYVGGDGDIRKDMRELAARWNPLLDPQAHANLIEDVNALVRDFVRKLKLVSRLQAPDAARLEKLADELSKHQALNGIKDKDNLKDYLALYMIELLGKI